MIGARKTVLAVAARGGLIDELRKRDLVVEEKGWSEDIITQLQAGGTRLRAIVLGAHGLSTDRRGQSRFLSRVKALRPVIERDNILLVVDAGVLGIDPESQKTAANLLHVAMQGHHNPNLAYLSRLETPRQAQAIACHEPGPAWRNIKLNLADGTELDTEEVELIQRAVSDANEATIRRIGRKSIFRVDAQMAQEPDRHPFLVKIISNGASADREAANYSALCQETIPYYSLPPIIPARCATGPSKRCLVFHFADHTITLAESLRTRSPSRAIAALFDGALRQWRAASREEDVQPGQSLFELNVVSNASLRYQNTYELTQQDGGEPARAPQEIIDDIRGYPSRKMRVCRSHGDLHAGNVLSNEGAEEVSLIDFARSRDAAATIDPAELEASIGFLMVPGVEPISDAEASDLYNADLFTERSALSRSASKRALGIQQVRRQISCEVDVADYANTLAASLLFYARKSTTAYRAADRLSRVRP